MVEVGGRERGVGAAGVVFAFLLAARERSVCAGLLVEGCCGWDWDWGGEIWD